MSKNSAKSTYEAFSNWLFIFRKRSKSINLTELKQDYKVNIKK